MLLDIFREMCLLFRIFLKRLEVLFLKEDRRIRRTQRLLKESLVELMSEKEFKDITIKDITERADLNRGTFYLHYSDTYELLLSMENDVLNDFQEMIDQYIAAEPHTDLMPVLVPVIHYIVKNEEICTILFECSASTEFLLRFKELIYKNGMHIIERLYPKSNSTAAQYCFDFVTYGLIGIIKKWLKAGMPESETEIARIGNTAVLSVAKSFFASIAH